MKRIMKPRAAALAFAAPLLFAAPALADHGTHQKRVSGGVAFETSNGGFYLNIGDRRYGSAGYDTRRNYGHNTYRQSYRQLKRRAIRACRAAIRDEAYYLGFHDVDFDDGRYAEQIGPRGFRVTFNEVEFESRRRDIERPVTCIVRRGDRVVDIRGLPVRRAPRSNHRRGYYK